MLRVGLLVKDRVQGILPPLGAASNSVGDYLRGIKQCAACEAGTMTGRAGQNTLCFVRGSDNVQACTGKAGASPNFAPSSIMSLYAAS